MSNQLLDPFRGKGHIHSPLDDYRSLFYVAQWACVFHELSLEDKPSDPDHIRDLRADLSRHYKTRSYTTHIVATAGMEKYEYGPWVAKSASFFSAWDYSLNLTRAKWIRIAESKGHNKKTFR
ncbi:hypothetical protein BDP27DRAFT_1432451 [Rhodocollybia butyracea]|uniref:Uncharacterized protein n=1 Tax=Rhodocollybia butyracea TaxID=206335 RepID=A0A9P5TXD4_9AGAR|nr:hypothetical protein BDP27DRAFT_1432451 [Rhodocollybia butyracea]